MTPRPGDIQTGICPTRPAGRRTRCEQPAMRSTDGCVFWSPSSTPPDLDFTPVVAVNRLRWMPIYEFECEECGERFEELVAASVGNAPCPACESARTRRLISTVSPPGGRARGGG